MKKIKAAWICHFSNKNVRNRLPLSAMKVSNRIKSLFGKPIHSGYSDFAPWVTKLIKEFEVFDDIELHIIAPHFGLTCLWYEFEMDGIFYHFFQPDLPVIHITPPGLPFFGGNHNFLLNRYYVKRFLKRINPDIVNLIGTENPYYSSTTLDINNIPVYVTVQTIYTNPDRKTYSDSCLKLNWDTELKIHRKEKYFGCSERMHRDMVLRNNPDAIICKMTLPIEEPAQVKEMPKIFDFVSFAGIAKNKGIEELINALAIVKKVKTDVRLNVVGRCNKVYMDYLLEITKTLGMTENIVFTPYFPIHSDMHQHVVQSRFAVFPVKLDTIPSSILEAILLGLPVLTYKTTGTPYLNKDAESVLISDIGDINMLAENMLRVLNSTALAEKLVINAKAIVEKEFNNITSAERMLSNYRAVIENYHHKTPIPKDQLFNIEEFPIY